MSCPPESETEGVQPVEGETFMEALFRLSIEVHEARGRIAAKHPRLTRLLTRIDEARRRR